LKRFVVITFFGSIVTAGAAAARAQEGSPIVTDRPGLLFSSQAVGAGTVQLEIGLPQWTLTDDGAVDLRSASAPFVLRFGLSPHWELRLGGPLYTRTEVHSPGGDATDGGFGDLELGAKWHVADEVGARPSLCLLPSVILPVGEEGFSAEKPAYLLNAVAEWGLAGGWGLAALAGAKRGETPDAEAFADWTFALSVGRSLPDPRWSAYGEGAYVSNDLPGSGAAAYLGGGVKWLVSSDLQLDLSLDRGLTDDSADWLVALGLSDRF
jgi:Putative MetA-pathway of phenol degradation